MSDMFVGSRALAASGSSFGVKGPEILGTGEAGGDKGTPFAGLLQSMVKETTALDHQAATTVNGMLSGQGVDIHQAMIATQKADMAFELALQVRNKAVGAYQQMMGMQF